MQFTLFPLHINKFHPQWGCPRKKGHHLLCCSFCVTSGQNRHHARVRCQNASTYQDKRLNTVVVAMLADCMKNRDFLSIDQEKARKNGTVSAKIGRMLSLPIIIHYRKNKTSTYLVYSFMWHLNVSTYICITIHYS